MINNYFSNSNSEKKMNRLQESMMTDLPLLLLSYLNQNTNRQELQRILKTKSILLPENASLSEILIKRGTTVYALYDMLYTLGLSKYYQMLSYILLCSIQVRTLPKVWSQYITKEQLIEISKLKGIVDDIEMYPVWYFYMYVNKSNMSANKQLLDDVKKMYGITNEFIVHNESARTFVEYCKVVTK